MGRDGLDDLVQVRFKRDAGAERHGSRCHSPPYGRVSPWVATATERIGMTDVKLPWHGALEEFVRIRASMPWSAVLSVTGPAQREARALVAEAGGGACAVGERRASIAIVRGALERGLRRSLLTDEEAYVLIDVCLEMEPLYHSLVAPAKYGYVIACAEQLRRSAAPDSDLARISVAGLASFEGEVRDTWEQDLFDAARVGLAWTKACLLGTGADADLNRHWGLVLAVIYGMARSYVYSSPEPAYNNEGLAVVDAVLRLHRVAKPDMDSFARWSPPSSLLWLEQEGRVAWEQIVSMLEPPPLVRP
jgi:hypothetical protein